MSDPSTMLLPVPRISHLANRKPHHLADFSCSDAIGSITMKTSLDYIFSSNGLGMWLAIAGVLAVLASLLPARNASRVSVRDVLAYE